MFWKTLDIPFHLFVKSFGLNSIQLCQIPVYHHLLASQSKDTVFYWHWNWSQYVTGFLSDVFWLDNLFSCVGPIRKITYNF